MCSTDDSLVHSQATTDITPTVFSYAEVQRGRSREEWIATQLLCRALDAIEGSTREKRLLSCRNSAWFVRSRQTGLVRVASNHCRLRWCPLCARSRSGFITHTVKEWLFPIREPKLLTLTIKHTRNPLSEQIDHIYRSFRGMRRSKFWQELCQGGVWFFQITYNPHSKEWHPHIHCLLHSAFIPYLKLRQKWHYHTGGSDVLDIRAVYKIEDAAQYVARYASRPHDLKSLPIAAQIELVSCLHGKRMCGTFGTGKSITLSPYKSPKSDEWQNVGSWTVVHGMAGSNATAREILRCYHTNEPLDPSYTCCSLDAFIDSAGEFHENDLAMDPIPPPALLF